MELENKTPLSEFKGYETNSYIRVFKVEKDIVAKNGGKVWLDTDFKHDYQKDEMRAEKFKLFAQSTGAFGVCIDVTEEMLEGMLNNIREQKKKVYCMKGCS